MCIVMGMIIPEFTRLPPARRGTPRVIAGGSTYRVAGVWDRVGLVSPGGIRTRDPGIDRDEPCPCAPTAATDPIPVFVGVGLVPTHLSSHGGAVILFL